MGVTLLLAEHIHGLVEEGEGGPEVASPHPLGPALAQRLEIILCVGSIR